MTDVELSKKEELADAHDIVLTPFTIFRYTYSVILLAFSIVLVIALMFTGNTKLAADASPWAALIVCVMAVVWLSMIEGQQASLVGLPPVDPELYKDTHPVTYLNAACAFLGDNLDRYLMGRQFMVLLVVFIINLCAAPSSADADVLGMPQWLKTIFLDVGLGMIIFTCQLGQLTTQVNASHCMLDFINNYFALFTLYFAMCVEFSGVMHASYLIQNVLSLLSGKPIHSNEEPKKGFTFLFFWGRVLMSLAILGFSLAVVISALFQGRTMMAVKYPSVSEGASVFLFFFLMCIVGMLEGMQIAFFAVAKLPESERGTSFFGRKTCDLLFKGNGQNLPGFMIGRQLTVVASFFIVASITSMNIQPGNVDGNIFGVSDGAQAFLNLGFHAAVITTILASITWQLAASAFPIAFLNNPATYVLLCFALFLEWTGLCAGAWVLARIMKKALKYEYDEVYVGTPEERAANNHADKGFADDVGKMYGGGFRGHQVGSHDALDGPVESKDEGFRATDSKDPLDGDAEIMDEEAV
jgi:silicon transporter